MFSNVPSAKIPPDGSAYQRVLGPAFADLDPQLQIYFGPIPTGSAGIGSGRYKEAGLRVRALRPVFALLRHRGIAFAEHGTDVPFTIRNTNPTRDTLNATRMFHSTEASRAMTDSMSVIDGRLVDRVGRRGEIEIELAAHVTRGRLKLQSRRWALHIRGVRLPLPPLLAITLEESVASAGDRTRRVAVSLTAPLVGEIYGYSGTFRYALETP